ncbi:YbaB/EbfC family nucleoid-associated protein [Nocardia miyunensis]|uniref:YbaB/EbfC family nucleoid-associated protein n=1 Tax=Nocardia miyunensis TaxID=282684 RepID=UPI000833DC34|nr:YbaB/EbfC family nucleoid-associated protein [Nocardia miyunensis]
MADLRGFEAEQRAALAEMQRKVNEVHAALARIRVRASSRNGELGVTVDAQGHVQDIRLTARALGLGEKRLAHVLLETIQHAEADAARQAGEAARPLTGDPRIAATMTEARRMITGGAEGKRPPPRAMTEQEIQAADDAYFERMNRRGWR